MPAPTVRAALADREAHLLLETHRGDELDRHLDVVTGHHHLRPSGSWQVPGHVRRAHVELRTVVGEERRVTAALLLLQDVHLALELLVRRHRARLAQDLPALDVVLLDAAEQNADVVARPALSRSLRNISTPVTTVLRVSRKPMISTSSPVFTIPRSTRPVTTVPRPLIENTSSIAIRNGLSMSRTGSGISLSSAVDQLADRRFPLRIAVERRERRHANHLRRVAGELVLVEELADFHVHQVQHLGVFHRVALVERDHDVVQADLASEQNVLARLRHDRVERRHDQDRAVHLRRARDHVLDVVGVARGNRRARSGASRSRTPRGHRDRHGLRRVADRPALRDVRVRNDLRQTLLALHLHRGRRQRRLPVVDVTDRSDVHVGLVSVEFLFGHDCLRSRFAVAV